MVYRGQNTHLVHPYGLQGHSPGPQEGTPTWSTHMVYRALTWSTGEGTPTWSIGHSPGLQGKGHPPGPMVYRGTHLVYRGRDTHLVQWSTGALTWSTGEKRTLHSPRLCPWKTPSCSPEASSQSCRKRTNDVTDF